MNCWLTGVVDYTLNNPDTLTKYKTAAQISHKVLEAVTGRSSSSFEFRCRVNNVLQRLVHRGGENIVNMRAWGQIISGGGSEGI